MHGKLPVSSSLSQSRILKKFHLPQLFLGGSRPRSFDRNSCKHERPWCSCPPFTASQQQTQSRKAVCEHVAALLEGADKRPQQHRQQDRHAGWRTEPEWALLEGFFGSPSLNESNPYEWMGNERPAPEILAFLIMFIINSGTLIISLHSFCLINKWCACTFGLCVYEREGGKEGERGTRGVIRH